METGKEIRQRYTDSIKNSDYPYVFPAWGKRISKRGIPLPLPAGVMANYITGSQLINIEDLQIGFSGSPNIPLDFVEFSEVKAKFQSINTRVDLWVLPFVNVYGIFGATFTSTTINMSKPFHFTTTANFNGNTKGAGITLGGMYKGIIGVLDYNNTWSKLENIQGTVHGQMASFRAGHVIPWITKPDRNVMLWVGVNGLYIGRTTEGTVSLQSLNMNGDKLDLENIKNETADWYQGLKPAQKVVVKQVAEKILDKFNGIDIGNAYVSYSLKKRATSNFSMLAGGQFQWNKKWQFRMEAGFLGGRTSMLTSVNYRFGL
ncbi:hypothetical protein ACJVDK_04045 [Pedobacter sp. MW01-1-1]